LLEAAPKDAEKFPKDLGDRGLLRLRVHKTMNFVVGMEVTADWVEQDLWEFLGRCPRWRGKW
jgi:hypothetical protein